MVRNLSVLVLALLLVVGLAACGGGSEEEDSSNGNESTEENGGAESGSSTVDVAAAEKSFNQSCASCHGENLEGKNAPPLEKVGQDMNKEEILAQIKNGGGGMPGNLIKGDEAQNVAAWLATMK